MSRGYRPDEQVPFSAIYRVARYGDQLPSVPIWLAAGSRFPRLAGWMFYLETPDAPDLRLIPGSGMDQEPVSEGEDTEESV